MFIIPLLRITIIYVLHHVNCERETSYIAYISLHVLVFLPDDGGEYNGRNMFRKANK
jgi:hypothetical protein